MHDLTWDHVADWFAPDGSLLDAYVLDADETDWQRVIDLVQSQGWRFDYTVEGESLPLPQQVAEIFARRRSEATVTMQIWPAPNMLANTHFFSDDEVEFDFDRTELQGQHLLDVLCCFMRSLGRQLGKPLRLAPENSPQHPLIIYSLMDDQFIRTT
ncbi:hypothetical protein [Micromonospora chersina]